MDHPLSQYKIISPSCRYLGHPATLFSSTGDGELTDFAELGLVTFAYYTPLICGVGGDLMVLFELVVFVVVVV